jgi:hypothetical protein
MQHKVAMIDMRVLVQVVDTVGVERRGPALYAVHLITLL